MNISILTLLVTLILFSPHESHCKIHFIKPKSEAWKERTLALINEMNAFLPEGIAKPDKFNVAYVPDADASYYYRFNYIDEQGRLTGLDRVIIVGDELEDSFIHEYGHLIFDNHFRFNFPLWQFHVIVNEVPTDDIEKTLKDLEQAIISLRKSVKKYNAELVINANDSFAQKALKNLNQSLDTYIPRVRRLKYALEIQSNYDIDLTSIDHFEGLLSYNELFADFFAVSFMNDWSYMKKGTLKSIELDKDPNRFTLPPADDLATAIAFLGNLRDFKANVDISTYHFQDWEDKSPYWEFTPSKSYLRSMVEEGTPSNLVLNYLLNSIMWSHQSWVDSGAGQKPTLKKKNELLIDHLKLSSSQKNAIGVRAFDWSRSS